MLTAVATTRLHPLCGKPLTVAAIDPAGLDAVRDGSAAAVRIEPPIHVSEHDAYLLVPAGAASDPHTWIDRGVVACGPIEVGRGRARLVVESRWSPRALVDEKPFDATVGARVAPRTRDRMADLLAEIDRLPFASCSTGARLFDRHGLDRVLSATSFAGHTWRAELPEGDPTWAWSRRHAGSVLVQLAFLGEYEERYCLINPVRIRL